VEYDYPRMDIELVPSKLYTMAKPLTKRENGSYLTDTSPTKRATYCCEPSAAVVVPRMVCGFAAVCEHSATALNYESVVLPPTTVLLHPKNNFLMPR